MARRSSKPTTAARFQREQAMLRSTMATYYTPPVVWHGCSGRCLRAVASWPVEGACAIGYAAWPGAQPGLAHQHGSVARPVAEEGGLNEARWRASVPERGKWPGTHPRRPAAAARASRRGRPSARDGGRLPRTRPRLRRQGTPPATVGRTGHLALFRASGAGRLRGSVADGVGRPPVSSRFRGSGTPSRRSARSRTRCARSSTRPTGARRRGVRVARWRRATR